jgi:hypothetical protein
VKTLCTALALLASVTAADAQGIYMLNGRATPSVIVGGAGEIYPVIPGPQFAGPSPMLLAPPLPFSRARVGPYAPIPTPPTEYYAPVVPRSSAPIYAPPSNYRPAPALRPMGAGCAPCHRRQFRGHRSNATRMTGETDDHELEAQ